jgi:hypothetical protein
VPGETGAVSGADQPGRGFEAGDLKSMCGALVLGLKDGELVDLLAREDQPQMALLRSLLPDRLMPHDVGDDSDRRREQARQLVAVFAAVTSEAEEVRLRQARHLLGLSRKDADLQGKLSQLEEANRRAHKAALKSHTTSVDKRNVTTRVRLAALEARCDEATVRRNYSQILGKLLAAAEACCRDLNHAWAPTVERAACTAQPSPPAAHRLDNPLDAPEVQRVLVLCEQYERMSDLASETSGRMASFSGGLYVRRGLEKELLDRLANPGEADDRGRTGKVLTVVGEAGFGKTSLLWGLRQELARRARFRPLLVNAAWLRVSGADRIPILGAEELLRAVAAVAECDELPVVLLDTLDLLLHEPSEAIMAKGLIEDMRRAGARVVVTCRVQEAVALDRDFDRQGLDLGTYDEEELLEAIKRHVRAFCPDAPPQPVDEKVALMRRLASSGLGMAEVCHHPLFLRLLFEAYEGTFPTEEVDARGVLGAYFDQKVCKDVRVRKHPEASSVDVSLECFCLAIAMLAAGATELKHHDLLDQASEVAAGWGDCRWAGDCGEARSRMSDAVDLLIQRAVLQVDEGQISFRHQLLAEYVAARAIVRRGGSRELQRLAEIIREQPLDLLRGAVFEQAVTHAWDDYPSQRAGLAGILDSFAQSPSVNLQSIALVVAAYHPDVDGYVPGIPGLLDRAEPETVRRFVELTPRVRGDKIGRTLEFLRRAWQRDDRSCYRAVLHVLERFAGPHPEAVKDFMSDVGCFEHVVANGGEFLLSEHQILPRILGSLARNYSKWSVKKLLALFEAGSTSNNRQQAVTILGVVADQWEHIGSAETLELFEKAACRAQGTNGGQDAGPMRLAGGRLFACYWTDRYRLEEPGDWTLAPEWLALVEKVRGMLAADPAMPFPVGMRLAGLALALSSLLEDHPAIEPALTKIFPSADGTYGVPMTKLPGTFLAPLLTCGKPAGKRTRILIRDTLAGLPADPAATDDPEKLRVIVARQAVTTAISGSFSPAELAALLADLPSLAHPEQWLDPFGAIRWIVPAAVGGHPVAITALEAIVAEPGLIGEKGRRGVRFALQKAIGEYPGLIPQALALCAGWHIAKPLTEACRAYRYREPFTMRLGGYHAEIDRLIRDLLERGGESAMDAMNLWLEIDKLGILKPRSFEELRSLATSASVLTVKQTALRLMGMQAGRGATSLDEVSGFTRSLLSAERSGPGIRTAARDALVIALAQAGPLTASALDDLLSLTADATAEIQAWLREPIRRLAKSGRSEEAFQLLRRFAEVIAVNHEPTYQNKLANDLLPALLSLCENASSAELTEWVQAIPQLPVPFAELFIRALVTTDDGGRSRAALVDLAAVDGLSADVANAIKHQLTIHGRLAASYHPVDSLLMPVAGLSRVKKVEILLRGSLPSAPEQPVLHVPGTTQSSARCRA